MSNDVARIRRGFHELLFVRPQSIPRWAVGQVLHPDTVFSAAVILIAFLPVIAGLVIFHTQLQPPPGSRTGTEEVPWLLLGFGAIVAICGFAMVAMLGLRMKQMQHNIRETDIILRLLEDRRLFADDEQFSSRLKQLDYSYLSQDTPFGRARIIGYELAYFLGLTSRPGVPTLLSSLALCGLPLLFTILLLSPQEFGSHSTLRALLMLVASLSWQWGFAQLLSMTAGLGVLQQYVRERDLRDVEDDEE